MAKKKTRPVVRSSSTSAAPVASTSTTLTEEQQSIVSLGGLEPHRMVLVEARAGTGKTFTLRALAERHPELRVRYIAFNRQARESAEKSFPENVVVKTFDAVVLELLGPDRCVAASPAEVIRQFADVCLPITVREPDGTEDGTEVTRPPTHDEAKAAYNHVRRFSTFWATRFVPEPAPQQNASSSMDCYTVPPLRERRAARQNNNNGKRGREGDSSEEEERSGASIKSSAERMAAVCSQMWEMILRGDLPCGGFDVAEKVVASKRLRIPRCDLLLVDEAQDLNAPMVLCAMRQLEHCCVCFVGDPMQHIYQFRGTASVFEEATRERALSTLFKDPESPCRHPATHARGLLRSFRFGPAVAKVANGVASEWAAELRPGQGDTVGGAENRADVVLPFYDGDLVRRFELRGNQGSEREEVVREVVGQASRTLHELRAGRLHGSVRPPSGAEGATAVLFRTNRALVEFFLHTPARCHLKTSWKGDAFKKLSKRYKESRAQFEREHEAKMCEDDPDQSDLFIYDLVARRKGDVRFVVDAFSKRSVDARRADFVLATVHQSKGLEFHSVMLWHDLAYPVRPPDDDDSGGPSAASQQMKRARVKGGGDGEGPDRKPDAQFRNLRYVAATRAQHCLLISQAADLPMRDTHLVAQTLKETDAQIQI